MKKARVIGTITENSHLHRTLEAVRAELLTDGYDVITVVRGVARYCETQKHFAIMTKNSKRGMPILFENVLDKQKIKYCDGKTPRGE